MRHLDNAEKLLTATQTSLRELIQIALTEQQYNDVAEIARMADGVARLLHGNREDIQRPPSPAVVANHHVDYSETAGTGAWQKARRATSSKKRSPEKGSYPRFERDGDRLVKIGWSKRDGRVYEHRAPRDVVYMVTQALSSRVKPSSVFTMDQVLPLNDNGGGEIPSYQAYLALAWLRSIGVVQRRGKDGYTVANASLESSKLERLWNAVPSRH